MTSRDKQWTYHMCGDSWVRDVTHNPTGRTMPGRASIATMRKRAASGELLRMLGVAPMPAGYRQPTTDDITSVYGFHSDCCDQPVITTSLPGGDIWCCFGCGQPPKTEDTK
jgi:hypothetical protein